MPLRFLWNFLRIQFCAVIGLFSSTAIEPTSGFCGHPLIIFWNSR